MSESSWQNDSSVVSYSVDQQWMRLVRDVLYMGVGRLSCIQCFVTVTWPAASISHLQKTFCAEYAEFTLGDSIDI